MTDATPLRPPPPPLLIGPFQEWRVTPIGVVFSEWALIKPEAWDFIRPILAENRAWGKLAQALKDYSDDD